jgi:hypothetical protein
MGHTKGSLYQEYKKENTKIKKGRERPREP